MIQVNATGNTGQNSKIQNIGEKPCLTFSIASNEKRLIAGEKKEYTQWVDCYFYGEVSTLEKLRQIIVVGSKIYVSGKANFGVSQNGEPKIYLTVQILDVVQFAPKEQADPMAENLAR